MTTPAADRFHAPPDDDPFWTETTWFSFWVPEARLSVTVYTWFRRNLGVAASAVVVWDDSAELPWEVLHHDYHWHIPHPEGDLARLVLPTGLRITMVEVGRTYDVSYDCGDCEFDVRFTGICAPHEVPMARLQFAGAAHFDQPGRVEGRLHIGDRELAVDCIAIRDRSWGPRRDDADVAVGYCAAAVGSDGPAFHAIAAPTGQQGAVVAGYLLRDGELADLGSGTRSVERDDHRPARVHVTATDELGRELDATGVCINRLAFVNRTNLLAWMSLTQWTFDGQEAWGEDQDVWSMRLWRDFVESGRGREAAT